MLTFIVTLLLGATVGAQETPARFFIERIEVRDARRVTSDVIISESRLRENTEYSEADLSDAASRLGRLPFLLSADFALEKGSERGRYALVIAVVETKPFFYLLDIRPVIERDDQSTILGIETSDRLGGSENQGVLGARWFVGRRGAFHAGLFARDDNQEFTQDYTAAMVGYTQYDIFGTRAFVTLNLKQPLLNAPDGQISPQIVAGIPLSPNQTLTLTYDHTNFGTDDDINGEELERDNTERLASARWSYNTTNQPFVPTRGTLLSITPYVAARDYSTLEYVPNPSRPGGGDYVYNQVERESYGFDVAAARYFELSERNSFSLSADAGWARGSEESELRGERTRDAVFAAAETSYSHSLWSREEQKRGDSRFEYSLRYLYRDRNQERSLFYRPDFDEIQIAWSWVRRSSFGTVRLGVGYGW